MATLQTLIDFYSANNRAPVKREIKGSSWLEQKYGSWNKALEAAGIALNRKYEHSEAELLASLQRFASENGASPRHADCNQTPYLFDTGTYLRKLGCKTWSQVLRKAGLEEYIELSPYRSLPDGELLAMIGKLLTDGDSTTSTYYDGNHGDLPALKTIRDRFGSWTNVLKLLHMAPNINKYSDQELISIFKTAVGHYGQVPSGAQLEAFSHIAVRQWTNRFGAYNKMLEWMGLPENAKTPKLDTQTNEELKLLYIALSKSGGYANGAPAAVVDASGDVPGSDVYALRFGSMNKLRAACGYREFKPGGLKYTETGIALQMRELYKSLGHVPSRSELKEAGLPPVSTICRYLKTSNITEWFGEKRKKCSKCGKMKLYSDYYPQHKPKKDGTYSLQAWCKKCISTSGNQYKNVTGYAKSQKNRDYMKKYRATEDAKTTQKVAAARWAKTETGKQKLSASSKLYYKTPKGQLKFARKRLAKAKKPKTKEMLIELIAELEKIIAKG